MDKKTKSDITAEKILNTASKMLSEKGYANVTMRDIAEKADVALSQLTYHFKSKEGLFIAVIKEAIGQSIKELEACLKQGSTPNEKLKLLSEGFKEFPQRKSDTLRLIMDFSAQSLWIPSIKEQFNLLLKNVTSIIETLVLGKDSTEEASKNALARLILGFLYGTAAMQMIENNTNEPVDIALNIFNPYLAKNITL